MFSECFQSVFRVFKTRSKQYPYIAWHCLKKIIKVLNFRKGGFEGNFLVDLLGSVDGSFGVAGGKLDILSRC